jgi:hypothetical protein
VGRRPKWLLQEFSKEERIQDVKHQIPEFAEGKIAASNMPALGTTISMLWYFENVIAALNA